MPYRSVPCHTIQLNCIALHCTTMQYITLHIVCKCLQKRTNKTASSSGLHAFELCPCGVCRAGLWLGKNSPWNAGVRICNLHPRCSRVQVWVPGSRLVLQCTCLILFTLFGKKTVPVAFVLTLLRFVALDIGKARATVGTAQWISQRFMSNCLFVVLAHFKILPRSSCNLLCEICTYECE